jgi:hypothetical protein
MIRPLLLLLVLATGCARNGPPAFTEAQVAENRSLIAEFRRLSRVVKPPEGSARSEVEALFGALAVSGDANSRWRVYRLDEEVREHPTELHVAFESGEVVTAYVSDAPEMASFEPVAETVEEENEIYRGYVESLKRFLAANREILDRLGRREKGRE